MIQEYLINIEVFIGKTVDLIPQFWNFRLFSIDKSPITVGTLIVCMLALVLGQYFIRRASYQIDHRVLTRFGLETAVRSTLRTFISYFLFLILILFVLQLLRIPLTVFTLIGGALAVGIGLGSQSIVYDFLSGLIIVMEHPVREGDLIEMNLVRGKVERIGARATRVLTVDQKHLIIPNNLILSQTVINWTLSSEVIRSDIEIGVAYGSPVKKVTQLIEKTLSENKSIEKYPQPVILLSNFGENSIIFTAYFWTSIKSLIDFKKIQSDLRFRILELFEENDIVIAFPQRDVHLHSSQNPLQVKVLKDSPPSEKT